MYGILGGVYGALLSIMNLMNAQLSAIYGNWAATVMIHLVGLAVLFPFSFGWGRSKGRASWYLYGGGLIGIVTVACCNVGISGIGVTANLVLMLLGQLICSTIIDQFGLLGARTVRLSWGRALSLGVIAIGDLVMLLWAAGTATEGGAPVCVEACPLRALDFGPIDELREKYGAVADVPPLPDATATSPNLVLTPPAPAQADPDRVRAEGRVLNIREIV